MKSIFIIIVSVALFSCKEKDKTTISTNQPTENKNVIPEDTTLKWVDYRMGELPPMGYYDSFDSIIRKWNIRYERIEGGCEMLEDEKKMYEKDNPKYFQILEKKFGKDWHAKFDAEVKALDSVFLEQQSDVDCNETYDDMENGYTTICLYQSMNLKEAYDKFRIINKFNDEGKFLEKEMPLQQHTAGFDEYPLSIIYKYTKAKKLDIEIIFPGGVTTLSFEEKTNGVKVTTVNSPD